MDFAKRLGDICNGACVGLALSLAKDTGILKALMDAKEPLTSLQIADSKGLKERYAREILDSLATAELLHVAKNDGGVSTGAHVYHLEEKEKKELQTIMYSYSGFTGALASLYDQVKACIPRDGPFGVRYSDAVHDVIDEMSTFEIDAYAEHILSSVDDLREKLEKGIDVIEFGCGQGRLLAKFASMFPNSTFVASDVIPYLLDKLRSRWHHIPNIQYSIVDLSAVNDTPEKLYDWAYCVDVVHDLPHPLDALKGIHKIVKKQGGVFTFIDVATSGSPIADKGEIEVAAYYAASTFLCIPESYQQEDSEAMGACWGKQTAIDTATNAGFGVKAIMIDDHHALFICTP